MTPRRTARNDTTRAHSSVQVACDAPDGPQTTRREPAAHFRSPATRQTAPRRHDASPQLTSGRLRRARRPPDDTTRARSSLQVAHDPPRGPQTTRLEPAAHFGSPATRQTAPRRHDASPQLTSGRPRPPTGSPDDTTRARSSLRVACDPPRGPQTTRLEPAAQFRSPATRQTAPRRHDASPQLTSGRLRRPMGSPDHTTRAGSSARVRCGAAAGARARTAPAPRPSRGRSATSAPCSPPDPARPRPGPPGRGPARSG